MRQLPLDKHAESIADAYVKAMHKPDSKGKSLFDKAKDNLQGLRDEFSSHTSYNVNRGSNKYPDIHSLNKGDIVSYIDLLLSCHEKLLNVYPSGAKGFSYYIGRFESIVSSDDINRRLIIDGNLKDSLATSIVKAMMYQEMREQVYPSVARGLGIKTCVYCNANYTITDSTGNGYYDLDHWKPKAKYPYLCTSFFNLQPSCPSCNRKKSDDAKRDFFQLWNDTGASDLDILSVDLTPESITDYLLSHDYSKLEPFLFARKPQFAKICKDTNEKLHINTRYKEHVDVAEEVIWKARAYNTSYSKSMQDALVNDDIDLGLNLSEDELNRFILGTYTKPEDIHKRPLTAFMQSIARQLELIK